MKSFVGEESSCGADTRSVRTTGQQRTFHHRRRDFLGKARLSGRVQSDEHTECVCECVRRSRWHHTVTQREAFSCQCFLTAHKFASFTAASHTRSRGVNGGVLQILGHNTWCPQKLWLHLFVVKRLTFWALNTPRTEKTGCDQDHMGQRRSKNHRDVCVWRF